MAEGDLYAQPAGGTSFVAREEKEERMMTGRIGRRIEWREKVRTLARSLVRFGRRLVEEHILLPGSKVELREVNEQMRELRLIEGGIRSRQLRADTPPWQINVADQVIVRTSDEGDVIVVQSREKEKLKVDVYGLRGYIKVAFVAGTKSFDDAKNVSSAVLEAGQMITVWQDGTARP